jgi:hypothetical protein
VLSGKGKIRLALFVVAAISMATSLIALSYLNGMAKKIGEIVQQDARFAELGEEISIKMLEARREEKNFIIYLDSTHIDNNWSILEQIRMRVKDAREVDSHYSLMLDSISLALSRYSSNLHLLVGIFKENPRALQSLQNYMASWVSDLNLSLLAATTKVSTEKARSITELKQTSDVVLKFAGIIATNARESLAQHSAEGLRYGVKAQRNAGTIFLITGFLLIYLILYFPHQIFSPFRKITKMLKAIERGETDISLQRCRPWGRIQRTGSSISRCHS